MHEVEWRVEGGDVLHTIPKGAEVVFWLNKGLESRGVSIKYLSDPYMDDEDPIVEVRLPGGKRVVVSIDSVVINQD